MSALVEPVEPAAKADPVEEVVVAEDDENNNNESMDKALITNDDESKEKEVDEDISDESDDDISQYDINNLLESDAVVVGNYVGIIKYLGPLFLDPFNTQKTTQEQYIGIECLSEQDVGDKGHDGWYNQFRYFKTKNSRKTGILIQASEFKKKLMPFTLLQKIKELKHSTMYDTFQANEDLKDQKNDSDSSIDDQTKAWLNINKLNKLTQKFARDSITLEDLSKFELDEIDSFATDLKCTTILKVRLRSAMTKLIDQK